MKTEVPFFRRRGFRWCYRGIVVAILVVAAGLLWSAIREARDAAIACSSQSRLNQLHLAMCNYHDAYGCFPPAYLVDEDGVPAHSWRVLILPFIEEKERYSQYRFDEPWNGPNNRRLASQIPHHFHMPNEPDDSLDTNIVAIVGPETAFPGSSSVTIADFADGLDNTILLAEITGSGICWMEPRDLQVDQMSFKINDPERPSISSSRRYGPYVIFFGNRSRVSEPF